MDLIEINSSGKVNKAETSLKARVYLNIEIDEEIYLEPLTEMYYKSDFLGIPRAYINKIRNLKFCIFK